MKKKTVQQVYDQGLVNQQKSEPTTGHSISQFQKTLSAAESTIKQAQQSIRQIQTGNSTDLQPVDQQLSQGLKYIQKIMAMQIQSNLGLSEGSYQQLNQLHSELAQAEQTLSMIQKSGNN